MNSRHNADNQNGAHEIFYYPYASIDEKGQAPLLKAVALYFDKIYIFDPEKAMAGSLGFYGDAVRDVLLLEQEGILERVGPEEMLASHGDQIVQAVYEDLNDPEYKKICETKTDREKWLLALAKVPKKIVEDETLKKLMRIPVRPGEPVLIDGPDPHGDIYHEKPVLGQQLVAGEVTGGKPAEYRYRELPLSLGESIMINHALFGSLLYSKATPFTGDPFHYHVLNYKIQRARQKPEILQILEDRKRQRQIKADIFAVDALTDATLKLPVLAPELPLEIILEYRKDYPDELQRAREELGVMADEMRRTPWNDSFALELEFNTIPSLRDKLKEAKKAHHKWIKSRKKSLFKGTGVALTAASATISLAFSPTPLLPVGVAVGVLGLIGTAISGVTQVQEWQEIKQEAVQNGLHYLIKFEEGRS